MLTIRSHCDLKGKDPLRENVSLLHLLLGLRLYHSCPHSLSGESTSPLCGPNFLLCFALAFTLYTNTRTFWTQSLDSQKIIYSKAISSKHYISLSISHLWSIYDSTLFLKLCTCIYSFSENSKNKSSVWQEFMHF